MADDSQNLNLQQSSSGLATGNPQTLPPSGLQNQQSTSLQPAGSQTFSGLSLLGQGSSGIALSSVPKTSSSTTQATVVKSPSHAKTILGYGGVAVIVVAIMAGLVHGLLKQR